MDNKKFIVIFTLLILMIVGLSIYSLSVTIIKNNNEKNKIITIDELNSIILKSKQFEESKVNDINKDNIRDFIDINEEDIEVIYGKKSILSTDASMYILLKPVSEKIDEFISKLQQYGDLYENEWSYYLESEYDIVKERKIGVVNNEYIFFVISDDAYDIIKYINI